MRCRRLTFLPVISLSLIFASSGVLDAQEEKPTQSEVERKLRGEFMEATAERFAILSVKDNEAFEREKRPLVRYSNPVRNFFSDGVTYVWLDGMRPIAAGTFSIRGEGKVWSEFTSFSDVAFYAQLDAKTVWQPESKSIVNRPLPKATTPAKKQTFRLTQFRQAARRFSAVMQDSADTPDNKKQLRLMTSPLFRWSDESKDVIDGALFSFAETTDPEALLMLEMLEPKDDKPAWRYSFVRMTTRPLEFRLDSAEIGSVTGYWRNPRSLKDSYTSIPLGLYKMSGEKPKSN